MSWEGLRGESRESMGVEGYLLQGTQLWSKSKRRAIAGGGHEVQENSFFKGFYLFAYLKEREREPESTR